MIAKEPKWIDDTVHWQCSRCNRFLPESVFYKDKRTPNGLKAQCKECHTEGNIRTRDADNARAINMRHMRNARQRNPGKFRERERDFSRRRKWDEKRRARYLLNLAVRHGSVVKPMCCSVCHRDDLRIEGHHVDYEKPLDVQWLCSMCHGRAHRKLG